MLKPLLNRMGKKEKVFDKLFALFPEYEAFIEPFAGSGIVGLNSGAKYVFMNDLDSRVVTAYNIIQDEEKVLELVDYLEMCPYSDVFFQSMRTLVPKNEVELVAQFLILGSWVFLGGTGTLRLGIHDAKYQTIKKVKDAYKNLVGKGMNWSCMDFRDFIKSVSISDKDFEKSFIYCDPPYLNTAQNTYQTPTFVAQDLIDLVELCIAKGCKFAVSEFENDTILMLKEKHNLFLHRISEVKNLGNRRVEILLTNYNPITVKQETLFV